MPCGYVGLEVEGPINSYAIPILDGYKCDLKIQQPVHINHPYQASRHFYGDSVGSLDEQHYPCA